MARALRTLAAASSLTAGLFLTAPSPRASSLDTHTGGGAAPAASSSRATTPAEVRIARAARAIENRPADPRGHSALAMAYARRARETADTSFYTLAAQAAARSLELAPDNLEARKAEAWILLGRHEFGETLTRLRTLFRRAPDDLAVNGMLVDALVELGRYEEAEEAGQWLLDLRPGNIAGLTRGAYLREIFGDLEGAVEFMTAAYHRTSPAETEDRAWLLTHIAHLDLGLGRLEGAESGVAAALEIFPGYHYALAVQARIRQAEGRHAEAAGILEQHVAAAPHPENLYYLAEALDRAGESARAGEIFARFERLARAEMAGNDNANRELIYYYAERAGRPEEALRIARAEIARRQDLFTRMALAWALYAAGESEAAVRETERVTALGVRDPEVLRRVAAIRAR